MLLPTWNSNVSGLWKNCPTVVGIASIGSLSGGDLMAAAVSAMDSGKAQLPESIRIVNSPQREGEGLRVTWTSVEGRSYALERWNNVDLGQKANPLWVEVARNTATSSTASALDPSPATAKARFYRIVQVSAPLPQNDATILVEQPEQLSGGGWRIRWSSVPFRRYELQRWHSEDLGAPAASPWISVAQIVAETETAFADDTSAGAARRRFYRVVQLGGQPVPDTAAPVLAGFRADLLGLTASAQVRLSVTITDESAVQNVLFLADDTTLDGSARFGQEWRVEVPYSAVQGVSRLTIRATDSVGNEASTSIAPPSLATGSSRFAVLDAQGKPLPGTTVEPSRGVPLPAVEFRPAAPLGANAEQTLVVKLAPGATLAESGGREVLRFTEAELRFGRNSALQFGTVPARAAVGLQTGGQRLAVAAPEEGTLRIASASPVELPVGALSAEDLESVLGLEPGEGVPIQLYGKFELRWHAGVLEDAGIRGGRFSFAGLPLPLRSGDYPEFLAPLDARGEFRLPFYGDFQLADGSTLPPLVRVSPADPAWLILRADGSIAYHNRSEFNLPSGGRFRADTKFDDPVYSIQIFADGVQIPMLGSLAQLLPPDPAMCIPSSEAAADLLLGTRCLNAFDQAVYNFAASAAASAPVSTNLNGQVPPLPPDDVDTALSILEAWSYAVTTSLITSVPLTTLRDLLRNTGESAEAAGDLESVVRHRRALARALVALQEGTLTDSAEAREEVEAALATAEAAAALRARDPNAINSVQSMRATLRALVETQELFAQANRPQSVGIHQAFALVIQQFLEAEFRALGVAPGQFTAAPESPIATMNRFVVFQTLKDLLDALADAAVLGVDEQIDVPFQEATTQMAARLWTLLEAAFSDAEALSDIPGFQYALEDLLDLEAMRQLSLFPDRPELSAIPRVNTAAFDGIVNRLGQLYQGELSRPYPERSLVSEITQLRRLIRILREVPSTVTFAAEPFERAYGRVGEKLTEAMNRLSSIASLAELLALLEVGIVREALRQQFNLPEGVSWDTTRLPQIVQRLSSVAQTQRGWSELHRAFELLRGEANRIGATGDQARRKLYLQQCVPVLTAARVAATAMWESERVRRELDSAFNIVDLLLPGDIQIDKVAGGGFYNKSNHSFGGNFKGEMRLPKFNGRLNVANASFSSGGAFDLSAFGTFTFQNATVSVPRRQPLHLSFRPPGDLSLTGEASLALANGMTFAARLTLDDPRYGFRIEARDLRLQLGKQLALYRPVVDTATLTAAGTELRAAFIDYWGSLNGSLEALAAQEEELPPVDGAERGAPPEFEAPQLTIPFSQLNVFANSILLDVERGVNRSYAFVVGDLLASLQTVRDEAALAAQTFESEARFLENQLARLEQQTRGAIAISNAAERAYLGIDDISDLMEEAQAAARQEALLHAKYLQQHPPTNLAETRRHTIALLDLETLHQAIGADYEDLDGDGIPNAVDGCPAVPSTNGENHPDADGDGIGDECDPAPSLPGQPTPGPCADYLKLAGNPLLQTRALLSCQLPKEYAALGIDFNSGNVTDLTLFEAVTEEELEVRAIVLSDLAAEAELLDAQRGPIENLHQLVENRRLELKTEELKSVPENDRVRRYDLALEIADLRASLGETVTVEDWDAEVRAAVPFLTSLSNEELEKLDKDLRKRKQDRADRVSKAVARDLGDETTGGTDQLSRALKRGVVGDTLVLLQVLFEDEPPANAVYRERIDSFIRYKVQRLKTELVDPNYLTNRLAEGQVVAQALADFTGWVAEFPPEDNTLVEDLRVAWEDLTLRFTVVAEVKRAWWHLRDYEVLLHETLREYGGKLNTGFNNTLKAGFAAANQSSSRIADGLALLANSVSAELVSFKLPGDLRVRRAFGGIEYNRTNEVWTGTFGGRVEFPGFENAFFEISNASVTTSGEFSIAASTGGPLPFGKLRLTSSLSLAGSLAGLDTVMGGGELLVPLNTTTQLFQVNLGYNFDTQLLTFNSTGAGLDLRLTDDFVLFNGGVGFDLSFAEPSGALRFSGSAGLFAREKPLPDLVSRTNFHLLVTNAAVRLALSETSFSTTLTNGTLLLPEFFRTSLCVTNRILTNYLTSPKGTNSVLTNFVKLSGTNSMPTNMLAGTFGPSISLTPTNPIVASINFDPPSVAFSGEVVFRDLGFHVPEFEALELAVCNARLIFPTNQLPILTNFYAALQFPLPSQTSIVEVVDAAWALDGFPTGTIRLRTDLDVLDLEGWRLTLLGTENPLCPLGNGLTVARDTNAVPFLRLDAGVEFAAPLSLFSDEAGASLSAAACGSLLVPFNAAPQLLVDSFAISNRLVRLGGTNGVTITNMVLRAQGLTNILNPSPANPFQVGLSGAILIGPGSGLGLSNAVFHFEGDLLPRFTVSELAVIQPGAIFGLNEYLPMVLEQGRVRFINDDLPIPAVFAPTNVMVILSGSVALPPGPNPVIGSRVQDLAISFLPTGVPQFSLDAIGFTLDLTQVIGTTEGLPIALGGNVYIGGLNDPPNFLFSGKLTGKFNGNAIEALVAVDPCGLRGICFGLAGSEINIPLAYGFVLTGAKGGVSFVNSNADPCDFLTYLPIDRVTGKPMGGSNCGIDIPTNCPPAITLSEVLARRPQALPSPSPGMQLANAPATLAASGQQATDPFPCPGDCPPAAVNIFCMPHPDHGTAGSPHTNRVVLKFTAIDESVLNSIGITPEFIESLVVDFSADPKAVAIDVAGMIRGFVDAITPRPPPNSPPFVQETAAAIEGTLNELELGFANALYCATAGFPASGSELSALLYETIRDTAWAGIACPDTTIMLQGSVSYTGVSTFADVAGGIVLSSTGSAGLIGSVRVFGMPVGTARAFVNSTDANGNPSPSLCGQVHVGIGPFELGSLNMLEDCPGCVDKLLVAFGTLGSVLSNTYVFEIMSRAAPELADPSLNVAQHLARLNTSELQLAFLGAIFEQPPTDSTGQVAPAFIEFAANLADAYLPRMSMCGEVNPKLFGFSLSGGNRLFNAKFYSGPKFVDGVQQTSYLMFAEFGFSPSQLFASSLLSVGGGAGVVAGMLAPALDEATASTTFELPALGDLVRDAFQKPPLQIALERSDDFLSDAVTTFTYRLAPLGMELGRASGRILMPSLQHHPRGPEPRVPPEQRGQGLPTRLDVLLAALGDKDDTNTLNRLGDGTWKGEGDADFASIFAGSTYATAVSGKGLSLRDDYFPHGGFLGAGTMDLPSLLTTPLPESLFTLFDANTPLAGRLTALQDFVFNHLLATERVGELSFYLPAPNPPLDRFPTTAQEMLESLRNFVPEQPLEFNTYYPLDQAFLRGWLDTPVLGVPTVRSMVAWVPAEGRFRLDAEVPTNSWFNHLLGSARFVIDMRSNTNTVEPVLAAFAPISNQVSQLRVNSPTLASELENIVANLPRQMAETLPKIAMELQANRVIIPVPTYRPVAPPAPLEIVATIDRALVANYSPFYNHPDARGNNPLDIARRDGGLAIKGGFNFLNGTVVINDAEFSVTPNPSPLGLPVLNASLTSGSVRLFGIEFGAPAAPAAAFPLSTAAAQPGPAIEFESSSSRVRLAAQGSIPGFDLGPVLRVTPLTGARINATAAFETTTSALPQGALLISPAQLESRVFAPGATLRIHGAGPNDPFTYSSTGPWNATVSLEGDEPLDLLAGSETVLRVQRTSLQSANVSRDARGAVTMRLNLRAGSSFTAFPGRPYQQTFSLSAAAAVTISSNGTFSFDAAIEDQVINGITVRGRVTFTNSPNLRFTMGGALTLPALGAMSIVPRESGTALEGELVVELAPTGTATTSLRLRPARLTINTLLGGSQSFLIDGGAEGQDFTFSTTSPWSARLTLDGTGPLELRAGNIPVLRTDRSNLLSATLARNAAGVVSLTADLAANASLAAFPTSPFTQSVRLSASADLSIASNGTFSLSATTADALSFTGLAVASLASGSSLTVNQTGFDFTGTVSGGVLSLAPVSGAVTATVRMASSGVSLSGSANVTVGALVYNQFRIEPLSGTTFTASLSNSGLVLPSGLRISYRGTSLGTFGLPSFTIPASGNYSFTTGPVNVVLNGFNLASVSFTFQRQNGVVSVANFTGNLSVPRPGGTLATVSVSGNLNSNGTFSLTGTTSASASLTSSGVPVNALANGASVTLTQNSLTLQGALTGGVLSQVPASGTVTGLLTITSTGVATLSGSAVIQPIVSAPFRIDSATGGNLSASLGNSGLTFSGARLRVTGILGSVVVLPSFTIPSNGNFTLPVSPPNMSVAGVPCSSISFTLRRQSGVMSLDPFAANLNLPGFNQRISGSVSSAGNLSLAYSGSLTMGGFAASNGDLHLSNEGLNAEGTFALRFGNTTIGNVGFSGAVTYNASNNTVSYNLARTSGGISIGGISIASPNLALTSTGAAGSVTLPFGVLNIPLSGVSITPGSGLSFDQYDHNVDSDWITFFDVPFTPVGDIRARLAGSVAFKSSGGTSFTSTLSYSWAPWLITETCNPFPPFGDGVCTTHFPPSNINDVTAPPRISGSGSISSSGQFTVNSSFGSLSSFSFDLW